MSSARLQNAQADRGNRPEVPGTACSLIELSGVSKTFGARDSRSMALKDISFSVDEREFLAIVGPSGCGKSTLLQIIAGLLPRSGGDVRIDGQDVQQPPDGVVYLFQQYNKSLFPWRTNSENVQFAVEHRAGVTRREARERSLHFLELVGLRDAADKYPRQLSGGMQQRVAIARALAANPRVLLLDEPFSSVDALTRLELHQLVLDLWTRHFLTVVLVTHDVEEAVFLSDRILVLSKQPTVVVEAIQTGLARPRDKVTTLEQPRFLEVRHYLLNKLLGGARNA